MFLRFHATQSHPDRTVLMPPWKYVRMYLKKNVRMCLTKSALMFPGKNARMLLTSVVKTLLKMSAPRCGRLVLSRISIFFNNTDIFRAVFTSRSEYETLSYTMLDMQKAVNQEMCHHVTTQVPRENCLILLTRCAAPTILTAVVCLAWCPGAR